MKPEMMNDDWRLDLAHQSLAKVPRSIMETYREVVQVIDLSNNHIKDVSFLEGCEQLTSIIIDHNELNSDVVFPRLPDVTLLWMNFNRVTCLYPFVERLSYSFPHLKHLSLMGNDIVPPCSEDTFYDYLQYRLFVLSRLQCLQYLDDRMVTEDEKSEALRLYRRPNDFGDNFSFGGFINAALAKIRQFVDPVTMGYRPDSHRSRFI